MDLKVRQHVFFVKHNCCVPFNALTLSRYIPREFRYNPTGTVHCTDAGVLDIPFSNKPAQRSSHTGPPGYIGWARFQPV